MYFPHILTSCVLPIFSKSVSDKEYLFKKNNPTMIHTAAIGPPNRIPIGRSALYPKTLKANHDLDHQTLGAKKHAFSSLTMHNTIKFSYISYHCIWNDKYY